MSTTLPVEANSSGNAPTAPKVVAATLGGGIGGTLGTAVVYVIGVFCPGGTFDASNVDKTIAAVPWPLAALVPGALAAVGAAYAGWKAPHQPRLEDVTAALAKYVVGSNETAPAPHDPVPVSAPVQSAGDPGDDGEDVTDGDVTDDPVAAIGEAPAAQPDPPAQPAAPAAPPQ